MLPPTPPTEASLDKGLSKLTGFDNWHTWHMKARMALQTRGLRYLLTNDGPSNPEDFDAYDADRTAGVGLLVDAMSEEMLASAYVRGWKPEDATVQGTLNVLETIVGEEQRRRRDEDERATATRRRLVGLARMDLDAGAQTVREYILAAKHCHDGLLTQYGGEDEGAVEALLEQLFVSSLVEGLRTARPQWHAEWTERMVEGTLGAAATRAGVTEWLLAKDAAAEKERDAAAVAASKPRKAQPPPPARDNAAAAAAAAARPTSRPPPPPPKKPKTSGKGGGPQRCGYCADRHPQSWPHDDDICWFLNPHKAPRHWLERFKDEVAAVREGPRKRRRSLSPLPRRA